MVVGAILLTTKSTSDSLFKLDPVVVFENGLSFVVEDFTAVASNFVVLVMVVDAY